MEIECSLPRSQKLSICPYPEPRPMQHTPTNLISARPILILSTHLRLFRPNSPLSLAFPPITYMCFSSHTFVLHTPPIASSSTWSFWLYLGNSANHETPRRIKKDKYFWTVFCKALLESDNTPYTSTNISMRSWPSQTQLNSTQLPPLQISLLPGMLDVKSTNDNPSQTGQERSSGIIGSDKSQDHAPRETLQGWGFYWTSC
jgi:hypothetical protein